MASVLTLFINVWLITSIGTAFASARPVLENQIRKANLAQLVTVKGRVIDKNGKPLAATVQILESRVTTNAEGFFALSNIAQQGYLLTVTARGYRNEIISINTAGHPYRATIELDAIILNRQQAASVRFLFGGDVAFGRRFIDSQENTPRGQIPPDDPNALILVSDPLPGSKRVLQYIRPYYQNAEWSSVNLETPVTDNPASPHTTKDYVIFSLPESIPALSWLGVDYVGLGNNHIYDYLKLGLQDTLTALTAAGLPHSGAGLNNKSAILPFRIHLKSTPYSFLAMTSITGNEHPIAYVATAKKGGAADLTDTALVESTIQGETAAGYIPIVQLHSGVEYSKHPDEYTQGAFEMVSKAGAGLVVGHHPHVAQGVGIVDGIVNIHSLGNLAFDQDRLETMLGITARVDMRGKQVDGVRLLPHYLEDYRPRPITGSLANFLIKRLAENSRPYQGFVYPYNNQGWVSLTKNDVVKVNRRHALTLTVPSNGSLVLDLRPFQQDSESLAEITIDGIGDHATLQMGRDLMEHHGDIEDYDVDEKKFEAERWDTSGSASYVCAGLGYHGISSLCSTRNADNTTDSIIPFRNRIRILSTDSGVANKNVTLFGKLKGINAGAVTIISRYYASEGNQEYGEEAAYQAKAGNYNWQTINAPLHIPADMAAEDTLNPRAFRFFLRQSPPANGDSLVIYDNIAAIAWENNIHSGEQIATPHAQEFMKIVAKPGIYKAKLVFSHYKPNAN